MGFGNIAIDQYDTAVLFAGHAERQITSRKRLAFPRQGASNHHSAGTGLRFPTSRLYFVEHGPLKPPKLIADGHAVDLLRQHTCSLESRRVHDDSMAGGQILLRLLRDSRSVDRFG